MGHGRHSPSCGVTCATTTLAWRARTICAEYAPDSPYESRPLHGAACHGCLLIAETSCEQRNDFLDRALVVPTVGAADGEAGAPVSNPVVTEGIAGGVR